MYPHGVTPPMKNCRKRRFRKTLRKKYIEAPEIEKELRRLFRVDCEAVSVKWELMTEDQLNAEKPLGGISTSEAKAANLSAASADTSANQARTPGSRAFFCRRWRFELAIEILMAFFCAPLETELRHARL